VYVLSRVTLGADVAVTSVMLDAAKRRYPGAEVVFVGPQKSYELFEADPRIKHLPAPYARSGALRDRLQASASLWLEGGIVIDPDSRLSQLGLISVCAEHNYFHFPSRAYGGDGSEPLPKLAARWALEVFGVEGAKPYVAPLNLASTESSADITVSFGVGENAAKRLDDAQECELLRTLAETGASILVDKGGSPEERERVERALLPGMRTHDGAFAPFAAHIAKSKLFVGYDSAGGHVASACGVPLISIAKGFVSERMAARWRPNGVVLSETEVTQVHCLAQKIFNT
jgi:ADP-heptose:LPS heptosyltransferase